MNTEIIDMKDNSDEVEYKIPYFNEAFNALNQIYLYLQTHTNTLENILIRLIGKSLNENIRLLHMLIKYITMLILVT